MCRKVNRIIIMLFRIINLGFRKKINEDFKLRQ